MTAIRIHVITGSKKNFIKEIRPGVYKVMLKAKPERNQANDLLKQILAEYFQTPISQIQILTGHHSPHKTIILR
jgi:uncharacterized protein YggU (UPF0235/DUF167 family)